MNNRLLQFIAAENVTQSQFADSINVARASISHIIAGRNKPGYDFITAVMRRYPDLNIEWLLCGKGKMYKSQQGDTSSNTSSGNEAQSAAPAAPEAGFFRSPSAEPVAEAPRWDDPGSDLLFNPEEFVHGRAARKLAEQEITATRKLHEKSPVNNVYPTDQAANFAPSSSINTSIEQSQRIEFKRKAVKIMVFFNDGTFQEF